MAGRQTTKGPRTVVITGASSGLGRATAVEFGRRGWNVALLARGVRGLEAAKTEVELAGGTAIVLPVDVSDARAVEAAADRVVREFGRIDTWVNSAAISEYAPLHEITPEEFRRITEVNYLGSIHGIRAALKHMRPRDRGHIIQVGSLVSQRAVPLQSAYVGTKYGIRGVLDALNSELRHDRSRIRTTIVQPPGMNTPFFEHARNKLSRQPMPAPPIYQPEVAARAIYRAAIEKPRELWIGGITTASAIGHVLMPGLMDRIAGRTGYRSQQTRERRSANHRDNLFHVLDDGGRVHGRFEDEARGDGSVVEPFRVRMMLGLAGAGAIAALTVFAISRLRGERFPDAGMYVDDGEWQQPLPAGGPGSGAPSDRGASAALSAVR